MPESRMEVELVLDSLAFGGEAVGRDAGGRVVFVAGGAPGDRVVARVVEDKAKFARAELLRVVAAGAARVAPPCPIVDRCGGCPWQHVAVDAQLAAKQAIVARALGKLGARVEPIAPSPAALGYRTRARMTARVRPPLVGDRSARPAGELTAIGFAGRRSHEIVDVERCIALAPPLDAALQAARSGLGALVGGEGTIAGLCRDDAVELAVTSGQGADRARLAAAAAALVGQAGIARVTVDDPNAPAAGFAQANAAQNETLRRLVRQAARADGQRVLELYAGDGNFTRDLAAVARAGVAVEGDRPAVTRLTQALRGMDVHSRWRALAESAAHAVAGLRAADERFDVIVLDPPRAGAADVAERLAGFGAARIVYVSCDPMTLARDAAVLGRAGYRAATAWPVDMMPQTWHIETVLLFERA